MIKTMTLLGEKRKVRDATEGIHVEVSDSNCKNGQRGKHGNCPYALAIKDRDPNIEYVIVSLSRTYIKKKDNTILTRHSNGPETRNQIIIFDETGRFDPGTYSLHAIAPSKRIGHDNGWRAKEGNTKAKKKPRKAQNVLHGVRERVNAKIVA